MLPFAIIFIEYMTTAVCLENIPGEPVPHAEVLDEILTRQLGPVYTQNAIFDFILGVSNETTDNRYLNESDDNLSMKVLDVDNVKKIVELAKNKFDAELSAPRQRPSRRQQSELFKSNPYVEKKAKEFMVHTLYLAKERINDTYPFRKKYQNTHSFLIAVLYGASTAIVTKMESLAAQMKQFKFHAHFIWYLVIYEKMLACNIDINNNVERMFLIHQEYAKVRGSKANLPNKRHSKRKDGVSTLPPHIAQQLQKQQDGGKLQPPGK